MGEPGASRKTLGCKSGRMGAFLDKPITEKTTVKTSGNGLTATSSEMQGWRVSMEDAHVQLHKLGSQSGISFFGVFDGHGGSYAAQFAAAKIADKIVSNGSNNTTSPEALSAMLVKAGLEIDVELRQEPQVRSGEDHSGTTAVYGLVTPTHVIIANIGDSRSVMCSDGKTYAMSEDHKPTNAPEEKRIKDAGGTVTMSRVNGDLAVSRALGDFSYKMQDHLPAVSQQVSPEAEITIRERSRDDDDFLILACDGIWDVFSNEQCVDFFRKNLSEGVSSEQACELLIHEGLARKSRDNMTVLLVQFDK